MIATVYSYALSGLDGVRVLVEADVNRGMPGFEIVGLPDASVKESKERVRSALKNSGFQFPVQKLTVNLAPAELKKEGSGFDLAVAIGVLKTTDQLVAKTDDYAFFGELGLGGELRAVSGLLPLLISAKSQGHKKFILPKENAKEASFLSGVDVYPAESLKGVVSHLIGERPIEPLLPTTFDEILNAVSKSDPHDLKFVKGQPVAKRALEVAVSGGHNLLFVGPPGAGKTMLARTIPSIMPPLTFDEALEITKIHSVAGTLGQEGVVSKRPFRTPHHTASTVALCGGGPSVRPGEISLAHGGVLFLDELPEYKRSSLEALRQPLEDGVITVARASGTVTYPASVTLCAGMNPCPCGNYGSSQKKCTCSLAAIKRYRERVSGPMLDRIDIQVEVDGVSYDELTADRVEESSEEVKKRVCAARKIQEMRFAGTNIHTNSEMGEAEIRKYCVLSKECNDVLRSAFERFHLSARARSRIIKVARTIADLAYSEEILPEHIFEAVSYRSYDKNGG